jgi:hypothetical protein
VKVNPLTEDDLRRELGRFERDFGWNLELARAYDAGKFVPKAKQEEAFIDWLMLLRGLSDVTAPR